MIILPFRIVDNKIVPEGVPWGSSLRRICSSWYMLDDISKFCTGVLLESDVTIDEPEIQAWQRRHNVDMQHIADYDVIYFAREEDRTLFLLEQ